MGNTIKNYEKKKRKEQKDRYRKMQRMVHNAIMEKCPFSRELKEKEYEVFNTLIKWTLESERRNPWNQSQKSEKT